MGIGGAITALSYVALAGAAAWLIMLIRKVGRLEQHNAALEVAVRMKDDQLKAASGAPRNRDELVGRLRDGGGL